MTDPLDELAAQGRSKRRDAEEIQKRYERDEARSIDRATRSRLWASTSSYALWLWWAWPFVALVVTAVAVHLKFSSDEEESLSGFVVIGAIPLFGLAWMTRGVFGRLAVARNEAKLRAMPFRVSGYAAALSNNRTEGRAQLVVKFVEPTDDKAIADALFAIGVTLQPEPRKNGARVAQWEVESGESSFSTNAHLDKLIWRAMKVLEAIHARHPIASVEIEGFR